MVKVMHFTITESGECFHFCRECIMKLEDPKHERHIAFRTLVLETIIGTAVLDGIRTGVCNECQAVELVDVIDAEFTELNKETDRSLN